MRSLRSSRGDLSEHLCICHVGLASTGRINHKDQIETWQMITAGYWCAVYDLHAGRHISKPNPFHHGCTYSHLHWVHSVKNTQWLFVLLWEMALFSVERKTAVVYVLGHSSAGYHCGWRLQLFSVLYFLCPISERSYWFLLCTDSHFMLPGSSGRHAIEHLLLFNERKFQLLVLIHHVRRYWCLLHLINVLKKPENGSRPIVVTDQIRFTQWSIWSVFLCLFCNAKQTGRLTDMPIDFMVEWNSGSMNQFFIFSKDLFSYNWLWFDESWSRLIRINYLFYIEDQHNSSIICRSGPDSVSENHNIAGLRKKISLRRYNKLKIDAAFPA